MKKTLLTILLSTCALTSFAQSQIEDQRALSDYIAENFKVPAKAMAYSDMPELLENTNILLSIELTPAGVVNSVSVNKGIDELFDNTLKTFIYLTPKGVCAAAENGKKRLVNVIVRVDLKPVPVEVARLIEMKAKRRFMRIKVDEEMLRQIPEIAPYVNIPGSSLWIMRSRAYQLIFTPVVKE